MIPPRTKGHDAPNETKEATHYVLSGAHIGTAIAEYLQAVGHRVILVDDPYESTDVPGFAGDPAAANVLVESGVKTASTVIVATHSDRRNLLIAQLVRVRFDVPRVIVFVNNPDRVPAFADAGHEPFCVTTVLAETVGETV